MISDLDTTVSAPAAVQKRRGVKPEPTTMIAVGEAPKGFWVVAGKFTASKVLAVLEPEGLSVDEAFLVRSLVPEGFSISASLAKAWGVGVVWCDKAWRDDMHALANVAPLPFPKAQRLLFA